MALQERFGFVRRERRGTLHALGRPRLPAVQSGGRL